MNEDLTRRFTELVRRELGAEDVRVSDPDAPERAEAVSAWIQDGRRIEATFNGPIAERETLTRRLEILVRAFESVLFEDRTPPKRTPITTSLQDELKAIAARANALDALVIDAHSPVIWASASKGTTLPGTIEPGTLPAEARETLRLVRESHRGVLVALRPPKRDDDDDSVPPPAVAPAPSSHPPQLVAVAKPTEDEADPQQRAVAAVRKLPQMAALHRGGHLSQTLREQDFGYVVRSFAGIYALLVVFDGPFDEIRAERAVRDGLPRVERLVLALPPLDPDPLPAGVVALRPRRRR